jgi:hypothetical protein
MCQTQQHLDGLKWFSCSHVYKYLNYVGDGLSKFDLMLENGALFLRSSLQGSFVTKNIFCCRLLFLDSIHFFWV